eukprot:SAG31_NODE_11828_length_994_cov_1.673743_1_plen_156_part_00
MDAVRKYKPMPHPAGLFASHSEPKLGGGNTTASLPNFFAQFELTHGRRRRLPRSDSLSQKSRSATARHAWGGLSREAVGRNRQHCASSGRHRVDKSQQRRQPAGRKPTAEETVRMQPDRADYLRELRASQAWNTARRLSAQANHSRWSDVRCVRW